MMRSRVAIATMALVVTMLAWGNKESSAAPIFYSTTDPSHWSVATNVGGTDGAFSSFPTSGFQAAVALPSRTGWIANNSSGNNGNWTFFVFRQTFDLTGYVAATADLKFRWAADDSGQVILQRGAWTPKYALNGGALINGVWPPDGASYDLGPTVTLSSGFASGLNTLDFYVEGNGVTDGFRLATESFTANSGNPVPEPSTMLLLGSGLAGLAAYGRKKFRA